jgi:hypothetical protein
MGITQTIDYYYKIILIQTLLSLQIKHKIINLNKIINQEIKIIHKQTKVTKTKTKLTIKIIPHQHKQIKIAQLKTNQVVKTIHKIK